MYALLFITNQELGYYFTIASRLTFLAQTSMVAVEVIVQSCLASPPTPRYSSLAGPASVISWCIRVLLGTQSVTNSAYSWMYWGYLIGARLPILCYGSMSQFNPHSSAGIRLKRVAPGAPIFFGCIGDIARFYPKNIKVGIIRSD